MKKTFKTMLALMAGAMTFTGCTSDILENTPEQIPSALKPMTFTATQESDATRAEIDGTAINWTEGDKISIFDGASENYGNQAFTLTDGIGETSGTFIGTATEATTYYALYPYASSTYEENGVTVDKNYLNEHGISIGVELEVLWDDYRSKGGQIDAFVEEEMAGKMPLYMGMSAEQKAIVKAYFSNEEYKEITKSGPQLNAGKIEDVAFPAAQTATVGTADPKAMLMIGTSDNTNNIQFKNVCAYLKVTPTFACSSIVLKSNGTESLAGTVTLDYNSGEPTTTATNGTSIVTLSGTIAANSTCYIAVLPARLTTGFTIEFKDASDKVIGSKSTAKDVTFARNKVINLGSFDALPTPPEGSVGTAKRTGEIDVNWVQLWENGPKFAEYNIGVTDGKATSFGGYYCWGKSVDQDPDCVYKDGSDVLSGTDDTATNLWGSNWRMPTQAELQALLANCDVEWTAVNGVNGRKFTGKDAYSSNSIFLPAAGECYRVSLNEQGDYGYYWSSKPDGDTNYAYYLGIRSDRQFVNVFDRDMGFSVRAVLDETPATKGIAKATINSVETDVNWVQLWKDGPKFAENNVADQMSFEDAAKTGTGYVWGVNWRTPSKDELNELCLAAKGQSTKVSCVYSSNCFVFTGKEEGYTSNTVSFPRGAGTGATVNVSYLSSTTNDSDGWFLSLENIRGTMGSSWNATNQDTKYYVRPVLAK